jgi:formylmethanofuran dehydrogenase subunit C
MTTMKPIQNQESPQTQTGVELRSGSGGVVLMLKDPLEFPLEAEAISPDVICQLRAAEIRALPVVYGNRKGCLGDFFEVEGERSDRLELFGNLERVKWMGCKMTRGSLTIRGNAGMHLGAGMSGGAISVYGNTSDWLGAQMSGGRIAVHGRAGGQVGGAYRHSLAGMLGGEIFVDRTAGIEVGRRMQAGLISVGERVGDFAGVEMRGGSLFLLASAGIRAGAWMTGGRIVACEPLALLPTFLKGGEAPAEALRADLLHLEELGVSVPEKAWTGSYLLYSGDTCEEGAGEIWIRQAPVIGPEPADKPTKC